MATWHLPISSFPGASEDLECQHLLDLDDACDFKSAFWDKISHWSNDKKSYLISWVHSLGDWGAFKTYMGHVKVNPVSDNENLTVVMNPQLLFSTFPSVMETQTAPNLGMDQIWHFVNQNWNVTGKLYWNTHFLRFQTQKHLFYRPIRLSFLNTQGSAVSPFQAKPLTEKNHKPCHLGVWNTYTQRFTLYTHQGCTPRPTPTLGKMAPLAVKIFKTAPPHPAPKMPWIDMLPRPEDFTSCPAPPRIFFFCPAPK